MTNAARKAFLFAQGRILEVAYSFVPTRDDHATFRVVDLMLLHTAYGEALAR